MTIAFTISFATIATLVGIAWLAFAVVRARYRRRLQRELEEQLRFDRGPSVRPLRRKRP